jgi:hypothetical protein
MIKKIVKEINYIIDKLLEVNLLIDYNLAIISNNKICWSSKTCMIDYMKLENLYNFYKECVKSKEYNFLFHDGSFIQIYYEFDKKVLQKHRLMYFNFSVLENELFEKESPIIEQLEEFEKMEDSEQFLNIKLFKDFGFIRFDYDKNAFEENIHPYSHCTINKEKVRIPVQSPLSPLEFINFILKHYYDGLVIDRKKEVFFENTICDSEKEILYFSNQKG